MYNSFSEFVFPKQIIICDDFEYSDYKQKLIQCCYEDRREDPEGAHYSNVIGWQSKPKYSINENDRMYFFINKLTDIVKKTLNDQMGLLEGTRIEITRWWINISGNGSYNVPHTHPFCHYSGVFYVKSQDDCGNIVFGQNSIYDSYDSLFRKQEFKDNHYYHPNIPYSPVEGRTILFPSNLSHQVGLNRSSSDRVSISFDLSFFDF